MEKFRFILVAVLLLAVQFSFVQVGAETGAQKLVAHYKFDGDCTDATGYGNNGTQVGSVSLVDGVNGKAARFEGGYIEVNHNDLLNMESGFTFSVWIYKEHSKEQMYVPILVKTEAEKTVHKDAYYFFNSEERPGVSVWHSNGLRTQTAERR